MQLNYMKQIYKIFKYKIRTLIVLSTKSSDICATGDTVNTKHIDYITENRTSFLLRNNF